MLKGKLTTLDSAAVFPSDPDVLRVKCVGSALEVWYNPAGTPGAATLSATDGDIGWGGAALSGWDALFDNLKVGYDADDDDDLDGSDDVVIDENFAATSVSPTHDDAGNLTKDADYAYVYDAWNNLVKVRAQNDADVVVGVYAYYADNRRASKTVSNRGDLDGVTYFFYDGLREIEERNGAEAVTQQYVWGHEYLDQLLMIRGAGGTWFVHQAEADQGGRARDWNVIALTTPRGDVAEEVQYQPYGLPQVRRHLAFGDSDADGDVDSTDNTARTNALTTYNRAFDADFDGDVSNTGGDADQLAWEASYNDPAASTTMVIPNRAFSPTGNPFLFTGRRLDAETGLYFYRFRTYHPTLKQFIQRDPLGYVDSASLYQYVGGRPTAAGDPLGLMTWVGHPQEGILNGPVLWPGTKPPPPPPDYDACPTTPWPSMVGNTSTPEEVIRYILEVIARDHPGQSLEGIGGILSVNHRFVWVPGYGWIDLFHFFASAHYVVNWNRFVAWWLGLGKEGADLFAGGGESFFREGDWNGNAAGRAFITWFMRHYLMRLNPLTGRPYSIWEALLWWLTHTPEERENPPPYFHERPATWPGTELV
ncbi:MAG: RHS repeat-associated core domain-containing protein [Planctomycetia bacterium]|nr:RHS repeat-associated core domain-containing protein [Planctomycetia bacterium]